MASEAISANFPFGQRTVWEPDPEWEAESNLRRFMDRWGISDLDALQERSVDDIEWFWAAVLEDLDIRFRTPWSSVVDLSRGPAFPRWCVGGRMNIVDNLLDKWVAHGAGDRTALRCESEDGSTSRLSYAALHAEVCRCANALRRLGLGPGDAVGLLMPMTVELAAAFLAVVKIGGVVLPLFSGYGSEAIATRLRDADARALVVADGFLRRGSPVRLKPVADEALASCATVTRSLVVRYLADDPTPMVPGRDVWWHDIVPGESPKAATEDTGAEDPLMIIYTSGTTGRPKGAVHTHCGFPVKAAQDMFHAMDVKPSDVVYWMTDMGWMMGPWLVFGTLLLGASMVFYDGAPDVPGPDRVWQLVADHGVTHLGLSPVLVRALRAHGPEPVRRHDLSRLRAAASTGSPWDPESWMWLFEYALQSRKPILNYSGGTEISGGIVCGNFLRPLKPCAFSGPVPGMAADVVDEAGNPVRGAVGELVVRRPWIGMTRGFWRDPDRYLETYWSRFEGVWVHGDFAAIDEDGLWYILGRSDDTIKIAGKRVGPAEVEAAVIAHPAVAECAAIGVPDPVKGEALAVFCVLRPDATPDETLRTDLHALLVDRLGKPLAPREIRFVASLPKTRNAKVMRRVIRAVHLGRDPGDTSSLEDASTLDAIRNAV